MIRSVRRIGGVSPLPLIGKRLRVLAAVSLFRWPPVTGMAWAWCKFSTVLLRRSFIRPDFNLGETMPVATWISSVRTLPIILDRLATVGLLWCGCILAVPILADPVQAQSPVPRGPMLQAPEFDPLPMRPTPVPYRTVPRPNIPSALPPETLAPQAVPHRGEPPRRVHETPGWRPTRPLTPTAPQFRGYGPEPLTQPPSLLNPSLANPPRQTLRPEADFPSDYWIISTRRCYQLGGFQPQRQCLEYFQRTAQTTPQSPQGLQLRPETDFLSSVRPEVPVCIIVHGSLVGWQELMEESAATYRWLRQAAPNQPVQIVFFTWPSDRPISALAPLDFTILGQLSSFNSLYLAHVLGKLPHTTRVSLIGHSHGARVVSSTLHLLAGGEIHGQRLTPPPQGYPRVRVVLAAAAIDHHWLLPGERYGRALEPLEKLLNLRNSQDYALSLYPLGRPFGVESLGRTGFRAQPRLSMAPFLPKVRELEIAPLLGPSHNWPHYYSNPQIARAVTPYVYYNDDTPDAVPVPAVPSVRQPAAGQQSVDRIPASTPIPQRQKFGVPSAVRVPAGR